MDKLEIGEEKYPLDEPKKIRGKKSKRIYLHIYKNGGFKLYNDDMILLGFEANNPAEISEELKQ